MSQPWKIIVPTLVLGVILGAFGTNVYLSSKQVLPEDGTKIQQNFSDFIQLLSNLQGIDPESFFYGDAVYLHGEDSKLSNWQNFSDEKKTGISLLLSQLPFIKLDYSKNSYGTPDQIMIGPLTSCEDLSKAEGLIDRYHLEMKNHLFHGENILNTLAPCFDYASSFQTKNDQDPKISTPSSKNTTITGTFIASDLFGGTEKGCDFDANAHIGDQISCNEGYVGMAIETKDKIILLEGYDCQATEILVKEEQGTRTEYETSNCTDELEPGKTYSVTGILELHKDQWHGGKQRDEWWIQVQEIKVFP